MELPASLSVKDLADLLRISSIEAVKQLMRNGIMANVNQVINYDVAAVVASGYGYEAKPKARAKAAASAAVRIKKQVKEESSADLHYRPPVVTIMGHVDHGKTRLLDAIRQANVMDSEAGGITQHIGAYQVEIDGKKVTFLDTPGHEAFTAMRARGAQVTDIAVLVVAADDGVMPQTIEAINHAKAAGVPILVAVNKIDKAEANPELVKQQLTNHGLVVEEWGGDVIAVPVSAREKKGIKELLESILLLAEMEDLKANPNKPATGVVIEAEMDKSRGPLATVLVQNGTLKPGDIIVAGNTMGKVKALFNEKGKQVRKAEPATPVEILGLSEVPQVGDAFNVVEDENHARAIILKRQLQLKQTDARILRLDTFFDQISAGKIKELNIVLKTDVQGSMEPIKNSLEKLATPAVQVRIIHSSTGNITEGDVMLALASEGLIIGFNADVEIGARRLADSKGVDIRIYNVIYSLIDDVEKALKGMLEPTIVEVIEGRAEVRQVFPAGKGTRVAGSYVVEGKILRNSPVRLIRKGKVITDTTVISMRRFKDDVREVAAGFECGIGLKDYNELQVGDILEFYRKQAQTA
ncbi:MAG TPA: translation initiation factor IF-2 [Dehalococcoidales bacterium]|nr:translation initiation factor IF-2 [Dehalococcoidales bacterium]